MKYHLLFLLLVLGMSASAQILTPKEIIQARKTTVPVYDFEGLASFLQPKGDSTYVVNFWATWCIPCVQELPYFEQLLEKYKGEKLKVILVSLDFRKQMDKSLIPFMVRKKLKSEVVLLDDKNANTWINQVDSSWSGALPATLILNKKHRLFFEKSFTFEELENEYLKSKK